MLYESGNDNEGTWNKLTKKNKTGNSSRSKKENGVANGADAEGVIQWLVYVVIALCTSLFSVWNKHIVTRLSKAEKRTDENTDRIHDFDKSMKDHVNAKFSELDQKLEARRLETKQDVRDMHKKIDSGHSEILKEIRNGHS